MKVKITKLNKVLISKSKGQTIEFTLKEAEILTALLLKKIGITNATRRLT